MVFQNRKITGIAVFCYFLLLTLLVIQPVLIPWKPDRLIVGDDVHRQYYFFRQFFRLSLANGEIPWWNPYVFAGKPFLANSQVAPFYPPNWLFLAFPLPFAYILHFALHLLIAVLGMFVFMRLFAGVLPAVFAGTVFAFSGYFAARVQAGQPEVIGSAAWLPWIMWAFTRLWNTPSAGGILRAGGLTAVQMLTGYQIVTMFTLEGVGIAAVWYCLVRRTIRPILNTALAATAAFGLAAIQLVPASEFFTRSIRTFHPPYSWVSQGAIFGKWWKELVIPFVNGDFRQYGGVPPNYHEHAAYAGIVPLLLAATAILYFGVSVIRKKIRGQAWITVSLLCIGIYSLWVSSASHAPFDLQYVLWKILPTYSYIRFPPRHLVLYVFAVAGLSGLAFTLIRNRVARVVIFGLLLFDLVPYARHFIYSEPVPELRHDQALVSRLTAGRVGSTGSLSGRLPVSHTGQDLFRVLPNFGVWIEPRDALDFESPAMYGYFSATGYDPSILANYYGFIDAAIGTEGNSFLSHDVQVPYLTITSPYTDFLNIRYILLPYGWDQYSGSARFVKAADVPDKQYTLIENTAVLPRFFLVGEVLTGKTVEDRKALIRQGVLDAGRAVVVSEEAAGQSGTGFLDCPAGTEFPPVGVTRYGITSITLTVQSPCTAILSTSEVMYPGWKAFMDGKPVPSMESNPAFRAVVVPKGSHNLRFSYEPVIFLIGAGMSCLTFCSMVVLRKRVSRFL